MSIDARRRLATSPKESPYTDSQRDESEKERPLIEERFGKKREEDSTDKSKRESDGVSEQDFSETVRIIRTERRENGQRIEVSDDE